MYIDCSAKTRVGIRQAFEEVVQKILDTPALLNEASGSVSLLAGERPAEGGSSSYCSYC